MSNPKKTVFISYAEADTGYAEAVAKSLEKAGGSVWHDKRINAGEDWDSEIQNALSSSSVMVLVASAASLSSPWVNYEIGSAISAGVPVLPVLVGEVVTLPSHLRHTQAVDVRGMDGEVMGAKVATAVENLKVTGDA